MDIFSKEKRSKIMSKVRTKDTNPELVVRRFLFSIGFRYRIHVAELPGKPDIVFRKSKSIIFVNGCFWHHHVGCGKSKLPVTNFEFWREKIMSNVERDHKNYSLLEEIGWRVLVIWECEVEKQEFQTKLSNFLNHDIESVEGW